MTTSRLQYKHCSGQYIIFVFARQEFTFCLLFLCVNYMSAWTAVPSHAELCLYRCTNSFADRKRRVRTRRRQHSANDVDEEDIRPPCADHDVIPIAVNKCSYRLLCECVRAQGHNLNSTREMGWELCHQAPEFYFIQTTRKRNSQAW